MGKGSQTLQTEQNFYWTDQKQKIQHNYL